MVPMSAGLVLLILKPTPPFLSSGYKWPMLAPALCLKSFISSISVKPAHDTFAMPATRVTCPLCTCFLPLKYPVTVVKSAAVALASNAVCSPLTSPMAMASMAFASAAVRLVISPAALRPTNCEAATVIAAMVPLLFLYTMVLLALYADNASFASKAACKPSTSAMATASMVFTSAALSHLANVLLLLN